MQTKRQIDSLFQSLIRQKAWGASLGWGSFVTLEFGRKRLYNHHYHGEWHLWLYLCDWDLRSNDRLLADSESKRKLMQLAIDNLNGAEFRGIRFDSQRMITEFMFESGLQLRCKPYPDAPPEDDCWMLFMPDGKVASLRESGLHYEPMSGIPDESLARR